MQQVMQVNIKKLLVMPVLALFFSILITGNAHAAQGDVNFKFFVDMSLNGKSMEMEFENTETFEIVSVKTDKFKKEDLHTQLPEGTYELLDIRFDNDVWFDYECKIDKSSFTVTKDGVEGVADNTINVFAKYRPITNTSITARFNVVSDDAFDGTVQIHLSGTTDAYYSEKSQDVLQKEEYTIVLDHMDSKAATVNAGNWTVDSINAYDSAGNPVSISYPQNIVLDKKTDAEYGKDIPLYIPAQDADGYVTKKSADMETYQWMGDNKRTLSYDDAVGRPITYSDTDSSAVSEESSSVQESADMEEGDPGADPLPKNGRKSHGHISKAAIILPVGIVIVLLGWLFFRKKRY